jgi:Fe2+ or Zn2+ uptake regulation protein
VTVLRAFLSTCAFITKREFLDSHALVKPFNYAGINIETAYLALTVVLQRNLSVHVLERAVAGGVVVCQYTMANSKKELECLHCGVTNESTVHSCIVLAEFEANGVRNKIAGTATG